MGEPPIAMLLPLHTDVFEPALAESGVPEQGFIGTARHEPTGVVPDQVIVTDDAPALLEPEPLYVAPEILYCSVCPDPTVNVAVELTTSTINSPVALDTVTDGLAAAKVEVTAVPNGVV